MKTRLILFFAAFTIGLVGGCVHNIQSTPPTFPPPHIQYDPPQRRNAPPALEVTYI